MATGCPRWKKVHKSSGATGFESRRGSCRLWVSPSDWTDRTGRAVWSVTCGSGAGARHKRGASRSLRGAKRAACNAAQKLR